MSSVLVAYKPHCLKNISFVSVLDTIRLLILNERFSNDLFGGSYADEFVGKLLAVVRFVAFFGMF